MEDVFGPLDSLITNEGPFLHVCNFSKRPIKIQEGQTLGIARDPKEWLQLPEKDSCKKSFYAYANFLKALAKNLLKTINDIQLGRIEHPWSVAVDELL